MKKICSPLMREYTQKFSCKSNIRKLNMKRSTIVESNILNKYKQESSLLYSDRQTYKQNDTLFNL